MLISRRGPRRRALLLRPIAEISNQGTAPCKTRLWREGESRPLLGLLWPPVRYAKKYKSFCHPAEAKRGTATENGSFFEGCLRLTRRVNLFSY